MAVLRLLLILRKFAKIAIIIVLLVLLQAQIAFHVNQAKF